MSIQEITYLSDRPDSLPNSVRIHGKPLVNEFNTEGTHCVQ